MKVLWICNTMLPIVASELDEPESNKEGWLSGLCDTILAKHNENNIELHVAFPVRKELAGMSGTVAVEPELQAGGTLNDHNLRTLFYHTFYEDVIHAETTDEGLEARMRNIIEEVNPDLIHCFGTEYAHTYAAAKCAKDRKRLIIGMQGLCSVIANAYMANLPVGLSKSFTFRDVVKLDTLKLQQKKYVMRGIRERAAVKLAGNIIGRTAFDRYYAKQWNAKAGYYTLNETLRSCFYEGEWNPENAEAHTIFVSQGDYPLKGLHYLLIAAGRLKDHYPDIRIRVGGNTITSYDNVKDRIKLSTYGKYLRRLIADHRLTGRVEFTGMLTAEEMKREYLRAGLFICCSSNENSPNSLGEAMILGVPCIAANVGGVPSIFTDKVDGISYKGYKENDSSVDLDYVVNNLAEAICNMWDNPEKLPEYSKNARKHAMKTHDRARNYEKLMDIYSFVVETNSQ